MLIIVIFSACLDVLKLYILKGKLLPELLFFLQIYQVRYLN